MCENAEYPVEVNGEYDLKQINLQISTEEARGTEFLRSTISIFEGRITNIADFKRLSPGTLLKELTLVKQDNAPPPDATKVWEGVMIVANNNEVLSAYRAT